MPESLVRPANDADVGGILDKLTSPEIHNPPNETEESLQARMALPGMIVRIDDLNDTVAWFFKAEGRGLGWPVEEEREDHIIVLMWLPRVPESENNMPQLIPVFGKACEEVVRLYPGSEAWKIYGDYPGVGEIWSQRRRSSSDMVDAWITYWNSLPLTVGVFAVKRLNPHNSSQFRPVGTVGKVIEFANQVAQQ